MKGVGDWSTPVGVALTAATVAALLAGWLRARRQALAWDGWAALAALIAAEWLLFRGVEPVATYFTPIAWTLYIVLADAMVRATGGWGQESGKGEEKTARGAQNAELGRGGEAREPGALLWTGRGAGEKAWITLLSIPLWLIFEAYNLRLENWTYVGLPENLAGRYFGYAWSFATITPGIFVTADLIESFGWFAPRGRKKCSPVALRGWMAAGAVMLAVPLVLPRGVAAYLFAPVWLGFIFLLDPVNYRLGLASLAGDWAEGRRSRTCALLLSGWACGLLWEFWNYWAAAKWLYIFPMFQEWKIFEMPAPGFLGFPPFALECFTMYVTARWMASGMTVAGQEMQGARGPEGKGSSG